MSLIDDLSKLIDPETSRIVQTASAAVSGAWTVWKAVQAISGGKTEPTADDECDDVEMWPDDECWADQDGGEYACRCPECVEFYSQLEEEWRIGMEADMQKTYESDEFRASVLEWEAETGLVANAPRLWESR